MIERFVNKIAVKNYYQRFIALHDLLFFPITLSLNNNKVFSFFYLQYNKAQGIYFYQITLIKRSTLISNISFSTNTKMNSQKHYNGKYKQQQMIGKGRYGTIYRIEELSTGKQFVAKHIPLGQIEQSVAKKQQLQIIKRLRHPYIVEYIDSFTSSEDFIIIMEYCRQKDLDHHIQLMKSRTKHFNQNIIITWMFQLVLGIQFIHSKKILHRDIKPQNVFIDGNLNIKIGDFGISKILASTGQQCSTMTGTPFYLSPQIINEELYTTKADIWSLGCVIYEICSLEKPFEAKGGILKLMQVIKTGEIKPIPKIYSQDLRKLVGKMMIRDQSKRPNTTQLLKDPLLMDLMIKSSSSMSLRNQYTKNIQKPAQQYLSQSFINKQTNMVHEQLRKFQLQIESKMQGLKKRQVNSKEIDQQHQELKKKMTEIEKAIGRAFTELKRKAEGREQSNSNNSSEELKKSQQLKKSTLQNSSGLTDSSDMTIIESIVLEERQSQRKSSKIVSGSAIYESVPLISTRNNIPTQYLNSSILMTESIPFTQNNSTLKITSKLITSLPKQEQSMDQTLVSQYQQTLKSKTIAKQTLNKLEFLQDAISRNPNSVLNGSLLSFTLTMSQQEIKRSIKEEKLVRNNLQSVRLKSSNNLQDSLNLDLSKRSSDQSLRFDKAFSKKKAQNKGQQQKQQKTIQKISYQQQDEYYQEDFQQYQEDFDTQNSQQSLGSNILQHSQQSMKQKRRLEMNTIKSFFQQSLQQINNQSQMNSDEQFSKSQKVKNKYPLVMSEIKEQTGEAGSILSRNSQSGNSHSLFGI